MRYIFLKDMEIIEKLEKQSLENVEYFKVMQMISSFCILEQTKKSLQEEKPIFGIKNIDKIKKNQKLTDEAFTMVYCTSDIPILEYDFSNVELQLKSEILNKENLLNIYKIFENVKNIRSYFEEYREKTPTLSTIYEMLYFNKSIYEQIKNTIDLNGNILDSASENLKNIRDAKKEKVLEIKDILNKFIQRSKYLQEPIITIRNGRYVVPIKSAYASYVKGYTHDISKNLNTVYIEPQNIINLNNKIASYEKQEIKEIEQILEKLAKTLYKYCEQLKQNNYLISLLDKIFAKAKFSKKYNLTKPEFGSFLNLKQAYHLLIQNPVKNDIYLEKQVDKKEENAIKTLIITRPNTGGKTVTIKTIGLIYSLAYSGVFIPANEGSKVTIVENIFSDIGDKQSIEFNLSTFSSHMSNIIEILRYSKENSLILLDELGSGTDPVEGEALAIEILKQLNLKNTLTIATSHYEKVKYFAIENCSYENASVEFDTFNLKPTYKLNIGIPGKSYAFEIAKTLGLENSIIENAKRNLNNTVDIETLLNSIDNKNKELAQKEKQIQEKQEQIKRQEEKINLEKEEIENKKIKQQVNYNETVRNYLEDVKKQISNNLKKLDAMDEKELNNFRNQINKSLKQLDQEQINNKTKIKKKTNLKIEDIKEGQKVYIAKLNNTGIVLKKNLKKQTLTVEVGNFKIDVSFDEITNVETTKEKNSSTVSYKLENTSKNVKTEINLIGLNSYEAIEKLDKFIDTAVISGLSSIRVIHGKGQGILRNAIFEYLKTNPNVKSFSQADYNNGGAGATQILLK